MQHLKGDQHQQQQRHQLLKEHTAGSAEQGVTSQADSFWYGISMGSSLSALGRPKPDPSIRTKFIAGLLVDSPALGSRPTWAGQQGTGASSRHPPLPSNVNVPSRPLAIKAQHPAAQGLCSYITAQLAKRVGKKEQSRRG